jgi:sporulation protein YhbH
MMDIRQDASRFKQIVRGRIRENLRKYVTHGEMIGRQGGDLVSIPLPQLEVPRFRFGKNGSGGVGQGDGQPGDPVGRPGDAGGAGGAGSEPGGGHLLEVEVSLDELAELLGDELELPRIQPKGSAQLVAEKAKYNSIRPTGPESLKHFRRTYLRALRRQISSGTYEPVEPQIVPIKADKQYRSWNQVAQPHVNAAVIYLMDVSGSMTDDQKDIVRTEAFWIDLWLGNQYRGVEKRYVIHDAAAKEVDEQTFYRTRESGGTRISSAYQVAAKIIEDDYPPADWNLYCFQFSDGDNWGDDNRRAFQLLEEKLLSSVNMFCYGQVESPYGSGDYLDALLKQFGDRDNLITSEIADKHGIYASIKTFLGKGR